MDKKPKHFKMKRYFFTTLIALVCVGLLFYSCGEAEKRTES